MKTMLTTHLASLAAAALCGSAYNPLPPAYTGGATRNLFTGSLPVFEKPNEGGAGSKTVDELAAEIKAQFEKQFGEVKGLAEDALGMVKAGEQMTQQT